MARLAIRGEELIVELAWWEKIAARRGDVRVPLAAVEKVTVEASWWRVLRGSPGRGAWIPDVLCLGVRERAGVRDFVAIHPRQGSVACVDLHPASAPFARIAVSDRVPRTTAADVRTALSRRRSADAADAGTDAVGTDPGHVPDPPAGKLGWRPGRSPLPWPPVSS
ncbi:hypothetical protein J7E88_10180 [Streptomyces sp. ISL-10]|uniref:hypothetical protein n=1 Tax=Streptomyces sp. ISL-10 TaxID=2819172 RepID=UPI001BEA9D23|nr:hypothetical protein [Streptomyces sp. ISL-10]MBT2365676.1 hypothetical protein [Streptomyces sp. ISL-10]